MILIKFKKGSLAALEVRLRVGKSRSRKICLEVVRARVEVGGGALGGGSGGEKG